ncbi:MAG: zf-HC2 domain-containing protein [Bryobacterales bacterium]|nr:zf-HC2 domain-containing protein [Bryobacterales bacterium]
MNHPGELDLQMFADGEMSATESARIAMHLDECGECRGEVEILRLVRKAASESHSQAKADMPPPPRPWASWQELTAKENTAKENVVEFPAPPRRQAKPESRFSGPRWAAMAATVFLGAMVVYWLSTPEKMNAAQLLERAMVAERKASTSKSRRRLRIRTGQQTFVRSNAAVLIQEDVRLRDLFQRAKYDWNNPLSAEAFAKWRAQLAEKQDDVDRDAERYQIRTTTSQGPLEEATLVLSAGDLHPVRCSFRFDSNVTVEVDEAGDEPAPVAGTPGVTPRDRGEAASGGAVNLRPPVAAQLSNAAQELQLIAALHRLGADLGEPVEWTRDGARLVVTGAGLTATRKRQVQSALAVIPNVEWSDEEAGPMEGGRASRELARSTARRTPGPLAAMVENRAAGRLDPEPALEEVLDASDAVMARAHALRLLADRFRPAVESTLAEEEKAALSQIRRNHLVALRSAMERLASLIEIPVSAAEAALPWQTATQELFASAQRSDQLLNTAFAATGGDTAANAHALQVALARLRAQTMSLLERTPGELP